MSRPKNDKPVYKQHGRYARCWHEGRWKALGLYGSPESYRRFAAIVEGGTAKPAKPAPASTGLTVAELCAVYMPHAETYYRLPDGKPTSEIWNFKYVVRVLTGAFPKLAAAEFSPLKLETVRQQMIADKVCRKQINKHVGRVRLIWKWAASKELVPAAVWEALATVQGLQKGRTNAVETDPVGPVDDATVDDTLPYLNREVRGLLEFQRLTGCRPGEACRLRRCDIDTSGDGWLYRPAHHKTAHRGKPRVIPIGPKARALLAQFPTADAAPVFGSHTSTSYATAVRRAIARANRARARQAERAAQANQAGPPLPPIPHWHPHQLRHSYATKVRAAFGLEAVQVTLGHSHAATSEIYAERDVSHAAKVAAAVG
jgi:integrase